MQYKIILIFLFSFYLTNLCLAQRVDSDTLQFHNDVNSIDSTDCSIWPNLVRSMIIPGWGQVEQGNPGRAVIFYSMSLSLAYNMSYNYYRFNKTNDPVNKRRFRKYLGLFTELYVINLLDNIDIYLKNRCRDWPADMFSDQPLKSPWGAVGRSAMFPGWGQFYNEEYLKSVISFGIVFDFARKVYIHHDRYRKTGSKSQLERRLVNSWYLGLSYFLVMVDAYVDAYLYNFDETMELTYNFNSFDN